MRGQEVARPRSRSRSPRHARRPIAKTIQLLEQGVQQSYGRIQKVLEAEEMVIYYGQPQFIAFMAAVTIASAIIAIVGGFMCIVWWPDWGITVGILTFFVFMILCSLGRAGSHYAITNKRVIIQSGFSLKSVGLDMIQNSSVDVGTIGAIFDVGSIKIFTGEIETVTAGKSFNVQSKYDELKFVSSPYDVLKLLQSETSNLKNTKRVTQ